MLLRVRKAKEAPEAVAAAPRDKKFDKSRYRQLGLYYHGFACFLLGDHLAAGKSLSQRRRSATDGLRHPRPLPAARVHHLNGEQNEREEARTQYQGVLKDHEAAKKAAAETLQQPARS